MVIPSHNRIYRKAEVLGLLNFSKSTLYNRINSGLFPPPIALGGRAAGWIESEIQAVLSAMVAGRSEEELKNLVKSLLNNRQAA